MAELQNKMEAEKAAQEEMRLKMQKEYEVKI